MDRIETEMEVADYQQEEIQMEYEKKETPFDGKENDWLDFARKRAEFYENVNQYIINMEIEIDYIDAEIAALMDEIENANCNVTQRYKMFKRLKDLRQARTRKENELKVLYNLTGNFDMGAMAEESGRSAEAIDEILNGPMVDLDEAEEEEPETEENVINIAG